MSICRLHVTFCLGYHQPREHVSHDPTLCVPPLHHRGSHNSHQVLLGLFGTTEVSSFGQDNMGSALLCDTTAQHCCVEICGNTYAQACHAARLRDSLLPHIFPQTELTG